MFFLLVSEYKKMNQVTFRRFVERLCEQTTRALQSREFARAKENKMAAAHLVERGQTLVFVFPRETPFVNNPFTRKLSASSTKHASLLLHRAYHISPLVNTVIHDDLPIKEWYVVGVAKITHLKHLLDEMYRYKTDPHLSGASQSFFESLRNFSRETQDPNVGVRRKALECFSPVFHRLLIERPLNSATREEDALCMHFISHLAAPLMSLCKVEYLTALHAAHVCWFGAHHIARCSLWDLGPDLGWTTDFLEKHSEGQEGCWAKLLSHRDLCVALAEIEPEFLKVLRFRFGWWLLQVSCSEDHRCAQEKFTNEGKIRLGGHVCSAELVQKSRVLVACLDTTSTDGGEVNISMEGLPIKSIWSDQHFEALENPQLLRNMDLGELVDHAYICHFLSMPLEAVALLLARKFDHDFESSEKHL